MNTRPITNSRDVRNFMLANRKRESSGAGNKWAKLAFATVLVTGIAVGTPFILYSKRTPHSIEVNGSTAIVQKGFCAVKCSNGGNGAFYSNDVVYVEDWSDGSRYRKKFYDKKENLIVEGIGNESDRWFFNPNHKGEAKLAKTHRLGDTWSLAEDVYTGDEAIQKWDEVRTRY